MKLKSSDPKRAAFKKTCQQLEIKYFKWPLDTPTRWSSTCDFLEKAIIMKKAINIFLMNDDDLKAYRMDDACWNLIEDACNFLKVTY